MHSLQLAVNDFIKKIILEDQSLTNEDEKQLSNVTLQIILFLKRSGIPLPKMDCTT